MSSLPRNVDDWGIPNWLEESSYGDTTIWTESRWRWEFTRRRQDCRDYFDENAQRVHEHFIEVYKGSGAAVLQPSEPGFCVTLTYEKARELGFPSLPNPRIGDQPFHVLTKFKDHVRLYRGEGPDPFHERGAPETLHIPVPDGWIAAVLDLSKPWSDQADGIRQWFEFRQAERLDGVVALPRRHKKNWLRYLRVIDGRAAGASWSNLAEVAAANGDTPPTPQNAKQVWEAAQTLMFNWPT